jgi:hypothetical protein
MQIMGLIMPRAMPALFKKDKKKPPNRGVVFGGLPSPAAETETIATAAAEKQEDDDQTAAVVIAVAAIVAPAVTAAAAAQQQDDDDQTAAVVIPEPEISHRAFLLVFWESVYPCFLAQSIIRIRREIGA